MMGRSKRQRPRQAKKVCSRKKAYSSSALADFKAMDLRSKGHSVCSAYQCVCCGQWHLATYHRRPSGGG